MNCNRVKEKLVFYVEGTLGEDEKQQIEQHLKCCEYCKAECQDIAIIFDTAKKIKIPPHDKTFWENQYKTMLDAAEQTFGRRRIFIKRIKVAVGFAGIVLMLFISRLYVGKNRQMTFTEIPEIYDISDEVLLGNNLPLPIDRLKNIVDFLEPEDQMILLSELLR
mgnify:CR=1 FL=1